MTATQPTARIGDVMVAHASTPVYINSLRVIRVTLEDDLLCAYANLLLADPSSGWELEPTDTSLAGRT